ncbi:GNAT family N-acetyltransferase [Microlunatus elymi]|uniref:GNAT family N-acetyltransferase n=1 Tax=Microlunatus elymi TaxID=2596828 RepID=A0A516PU70_9ACTN|nr:GNAT family N-acetyltransferase [Microlunatus elymi]QDP94746.1 GNAT family N-acetyltransferase [Microlunatus elymi]
MTTPRYRPLTGPILSGIEDPCAHCGYGFTARTVIDAFGRSDDRLPDWIQETTDLWGLCGVVAQLNGDQPGYLTLAPAELVPPVPLPGLGGNSADALSPDAAVLTAVAVCRDYRGRGLARNLVRTAVAQLAKRQLGTVEVIGTFGPAAIPHADGDQGSRMVLLPVSFWQAMGFHIVRRHPITPTLRLDASSTARWRPDFAAAWQRFADLVSQPGPAQPASFQQHQDLVRQHLSHSS